ncbi:hypothetical protein B0H16DRAFT_1730461 [Mycena metata]|uniref:Uncharacterized protein n=1 Tax=Mycena metata TaxID=1033252 RepID=A0AAD7I7U4_9AGAR|nr:hypothetical protein B0H16DRAFT_1730461 [Mycena metata]
MPQVRGSYKHSRPPASGSVHGSRPSLALDNGHVSCSVPFYPNKRYRGILSHENHENKKYYFLQHPTHPAVFTHAEQGARLTRALDPQADVQSYRGLRAVSNAIYEFCLSNHNHDITNDQRQASLTEPLRPLAELLDWTSGANAGASGGNKRARAAAKKPSPVRVFASPSPQTYVELMDRIWFQRDKKPGYTYKEPVPYAYGFEPPLPRPPLRDADAPFPNVFVPIPGFIPDFTQQHVAVPASQKQVVVEVPTKAVPSPIVAEPCSIKNVDVVHHEQCSTTNVDKKWWYVLSNGCIFRDATQAEAETARDPAIKWIIVDSLEEAATWMLSEGLPKILFMASDRWGCLQPSSAESHLKKHPQVRMRIVGSMLEGYAWAKSLGGASDSSL